MRYKNYFKSVCAGILVALVLGSGLSGCSTMNDRAWADPDYAGWKVQNLAVLGISESLNLAMQYESMFVENLSERGTRSVSVHAFAGVSIAEYSEEQLSSLLKEMAADAVLITRIISEKQRSQHVPIGMDYMPSYYDDFYGYYDHYYTVSSGQVINFIEYDLEVNLYDLKSGRLVWSGLKTVRDDRSDRSILHSVMKAVVKEFEKNGYL